MLDLSVSLFVRHALLFFPRGPGVPRLQPLVLPVQQKQISDLFFALPRSYAPHMAQRNARNIGRGAYCAPFIVVKPSVVQTCIPPR